MKILYLVYEVNKLKNKYVNDSVVKTLTVNNIRDKNDYFFFLKKNSELRIGIVAFVK